MIFHFNSTAAAAFAYLRRATHFAPGLFDFQQRQKRFFFLTSKKEKKIGQHSIETHLSFQESARTSAGVVTRELRTNRTHHHCICAHVRITTTGGPGVRPSGPSKCVRK